MAHMQEYRVHMAIQTRAKPLLAFGSLSSKHCTCQERGQGMFLGVPLTLFVCYGAHAKKSPCHPLLPSGPGVSPDPTTAWPGPVSRLSPIRLLHAALR